MTHEHSDKEVKPCVHVLKICKTCGNVYCSKCQKEWFEKQYTYLYGGTVTYPDTTPYTIPWNPGITITYGNTTGTYHAHHS